MKDEFDNISACKHGMTGLLAWQYCADGFPTAKDLSAHTVVLQEWSVLAILEKFRCFK